VLDVSKISFLAENIQALAGMLIEHRVGEKSKSMTRALRAACEKAFRFDEPSFADIYDWYLQLKNQISTIYSVDDQSAADYLVTDHLVADHPVRDHAKGRFIAKIKKLIDDGMRAIDESVIAAVSGTSCAKSHGVHIYMPLKHVTRAYSRSHWAKTSNWVQFLEMISEM
jgi:hypothetical protein